jgi:hypothetical protein
MELRDIFLFFGLSLALLAVIVTIVGMRKPDFPSRRAVMALLGLAVVLVVGTGYYAVQFSVEESELKKEKKQEIGEEASVSPLVIRGVA